MVSSVLDSTPSQCIPPSLAYERLFACSAGGDDRMQQPGHGLVRHVPTQGANLLGEPLRIAGILRQPVQPLHCHPSTACAGHPPLLIRQIDAPAGGIGVPHSARPAVVEGPVPSPAARAHGGFFRRTKVTSRAWGSPKIPCSRLRARNPGKENKAESVWACFMVPSWTNAARSVPQISDNIRGLAILAQTQTGCGVGELHALSFTHSNLRRAI